MRRPESSAYPYIFPEDGTQYFDSYLVPVDVVNRCMPFRREAI
jgi:hypothetical protein